MPPVPLELAVARLRDLVGQVDGTTLAASEARALVGLGEQLERMGRSLKVVATARVAATGAWRGDGDRSPEEWLARSTGTTRGEAARAVETGRRLADLPQTASALGRGELSARQADAIAGAASVDPGAETRLLAAAARSSSRELEDACRRTRAAAEPDPEATARRIHARRSYRCWTDLEGVGHIQLSGPVATIARIDNAVRHRCERIFRVARTAGRREPAEAYAFDAVEELATAAGSDRPVPVGADAKILVRVDHPALLRGRVLDSEVCEIAGVGPIPVSVVREWMGDAFVAALLTRGTEITKVVHLGRRFTSEQRTALQWQDPICARAGCANRLRLEYDHFEDWATTRTTRVDAGRRFCAACHRLKTTGWTVTPADENGQCEFFPPGAEPIGEATKQKSAVVCHAAAPRRTYPRTL